MEQKYISATHIDKLGHKIQEIRERALFNIISKLDNGVVFDNDLARSKELVTKLFKWFLFEPSSHEKTVFELLMRIFKSKNGTTLVSYFCKCDLQKELLQLRTYIEPKYYPYIEELSKIIDENDEEVIIPPLQLEVPLSYRTATSSVDNLVGTTATPIEGLVLKTSSRAPQAGVGASICEDHSSNADDHITSAYIERNVTEDYKDSLPNYFFKWQPLIEPDRHVLQKIEISLLNPSHPSSLLHSCEFFNSVLLHDFPAEIFLQRPSIILEFYHLLACGSTKITNAILNCFYDLTKALCTRILHINDVSLKNYKLELLAQRSSLINSPISSEKSSNYENDIGDKFENAEQVKALQKNQVSTPKFCVLTIKSIFKYLCSKPNDIDKSKIRQSIVNICLLLIEEITKLLNLTVKLDIWTQPQNEKTISVLRDLNETFLNFGETLEHFRLEFLMTEDKKYRVMYLCLTHLCINLLKTLVPTTQTDLILPKILKTSLMNCLLDVTLTQMYPTLHTTILEYIQSFSSENLKKYKDIKRICQGMTATVKFIREYASLTISETLKLASEAVISLEFHENLGFLKLLVDVLSDKLSELSENPHKMIKSEKIVLSLLAQNIVPIKTEMYRLCHKKVISSIGPHLDLTSNGVAGSRILFLSSSNIFNEIACFGVTSEHQEIQNYSENILIYILKSKMIVCEEIWDSVVQSLIPSLPIIACSANKNSILGKTIVSLLDPDNVNNLMIPIITVLRTNVLFMFSEDTYLRDEGFSRICWLLAAQENSRELLPRLNTIYDTSLATVCQLKRFIDVNKIRRTDHFYQPSSLTQVIDVLKSSNIEPVIRRSALNQISVMLEDPLLHQIFLDANGLQIVANIMKIALTETDYRDYPDSVIPIIAIMKNLSFYHITVREELSLSEDIICFILRSLFLYFTEDRLKQDATTLLFTLIFKDFVRGSPAQANFSLPKIVTEKFIVPFECNSHWTYSEYTPENLREVIIADRSSLSSIQIHWNSIIFGGFEKLTNLENINYQNIDISFDSILKLNTYEFSCIKISSISYCTKTYLNDVQNGTSHESVILSIEYLISYLFLYKLSKTIEKKEDSFLELPWHQSFSRFLKVLPSCEEDTVLLKHVIALLRFLAPLYFENNKDFWITSILKDKTQCLLDLICLDEVTNDDVKMVSKELMKLITDCVKHEQHYLDYYNNLKYVNSWTHVVKIIAENLKFTDTQHFYNLAYLDSLLSCLVHLTAKLGWSNSNNSFTPKELIPGMISNFCELLGAFHKGKGPSAALSVMGLSITRHVLLILNHLLAELQNSKIKDWERSFFDDSNIEETIFNFIDLWRSRDVIVRAAVLQLFSGLNLSSKIVKDIIDKIKVDKAHICELSFIVFVDNSEASIVRENAAHMLSNFVSHCAPMYSDKQLPGNVPVLKKSCTMDIFTLIEEYEFFQNIDTLLNRLFTIRISDVRKFLQKNPLNGSENSWSTDSENVETMNLATTPGLVKAAANFTYNILNLDPESVSKKLHDKGLVKLLFRTLCNPALSIANNVELIMYCDILEMNIIVCMVLTKLATYNTVCLGTILHTKDCFNLMISLLNPKIYNINRPQLFYLRNKLWTEIFNVISALVEFSGNSEGDFSIRSLDTLAVIADTLGDLGNGPFIETLCECLSSLRANALQNSALTCLICLVKLEMYRIQEKIQTYNDSKLSYFQNLLDSVRAPKTVEMSDTKENNSLKTYRLPESSIQNSEQYKINTLEEAYFGKILPNTTKFTDAEALDNIEVSFIENLDNSLMSGGEICKILLYLYDICILNISKSSIFPKKKTLVVSALSGLLGISDQAKIYALQNNLLLVIIKQLKDYHIKLSLESVDCLRRVADKKRVCPMLQEIVDLVALLNNFMLGTNKVKEEAATLNLADIIHKLWIWFLLQNMHLVDVLKMVYTYTTGCMLACQSLPLTSPIAGSGPRKTPGSLSLLHSIITLVTKQMDQISKTHNLKILELCFNILHNCCDSLECRILITKSTLFQSISRLHPAITKHQKPWESIEFLWLDFLQSFTTYPEGQAVVAKTVDLLELIMILTGSAKLKNRQMALFVLRNVSFYQSNKTRLLGSGEFLNLLKNKLSNGNIVEKNTVVVIIWSLTANSQKAKIVLKSCQIDNQLQNIIKNFELLRNEETGIDDECLDRMRYVLSVLRDGDKIR